MFKKSITPNLLTIFRIILVPIIVILLSILILQKEKANIIKIGESFEIKTLMLVSGILFIIASFTDFLDGYIARKYNYVSDFGKFFDPIADKMLINSTLILFIPLSILPFWIALILILRDTFVDFIRMILSSKQITLSAGVFGKLKTIFQMIGLSILFFLSHWVLNAEETKSIIIKHVILLPIYVSVLFSLYSSIDYFIKARPNLF